MSIFLNKDSKVIVQGITGGEGTKHTALMIRAGTNVVRTNMATFAPIRRLRAIESGPGPKEKDDA